MKKFPKSSTMFFSKYNHGLQVLPAVGEERVGRATDLSTKSRDSSHGSSGTDNETRFGPITDLSTKSHDSSHGSSGTDNETRFGPITGLRTKSRDSSHGSSGRDDVTRLGPITPSHVTLATAPAVLTMRPV